MCPNVLKPKFYNCIQFPVYPGIISSNGLQGNKRSWDDKFSRSFTKYVLRRVTFAPVSININHRMLLTVLFPFLRAIKYPNPLKRLYLAFVHVLFRCWAICLQMCALMTFPTRNSRVKMNYFYRSHASSILQCTNEFIKGLLSLLKIKCWCFFSAVLLCLQGLKNDLADSFSILYASALLSFSSPLNMLSASYLRFELRCQNTRLRDFYERQGNNLNKPNLQLF